MMAAGAESPVVAPLSIQTHRPVVLAGLSGSPHEPKPPSAEVMLNVRKWTENVSREERSEEQNGDGTTADVVGSHRVPELTVAAAAAATAGLLSREGAVAIRSSSPDTFLIPTRRALDSSPTVFLWESRTTNVDVMSVSNTTRPVAVSRSSRNSERRRIQLVLPLGISEHERAAGIGGGGAARGMSLFDPPTTTALEAHLNEERRAKSSRDLRRERHAFLERLSREREHRVDLEARAATMIQASFRGFLVRPRPPRPHARHVLTPAEANRRLVADLQAILSGAGLPTIPGLGPDGRKAPEGSEWGRGRGVARSAGARCGGRGKRSRKQRMLEDAMATRMTKVVRGFLERRRVKRRWRAWDLERRRVATERIQRCFRAYRKRMGWKDLESGVVDCAAAKIQARWRGMSCRMALARRRRDEALRKRQTASAITIQTAGRRRLAVARYGPRLTLVLARREREARAAAEAARPRRRWKGGAPASAAVARKSAARSNASTVSSISAGGTAAKTANGGRTRRNSAHRNQGSVRPTTAVVTNGGHGQLSPQKEPRSQGGSSAQGEKSLGGVPANTSAAKGNSGKEVGVKSSDVSNIAPASESGVQGGPDGGLDPPQAPVKKRRASMASSLLFIETLSSPTEVYPSVTVEDFSVNSLTSSADITNDDGSTSASSAIATVTESAVKGQIEDGVDLATAAAAGLWEEGESDSLMLKESSLSMKPEEEMEPLVEGFPVLLDVPLAVLSGESAATPMAASVEVEEDNESLAQVSDPLDGPSAESSRKTGTATEQLQATKSLRVAAPPVVTEPSVDSSRKSSTEPVTKTLMVPSSCELSTNRSAAVSVESSAAGLEAIGASAPVPSSTTPNVT